MADGQGCLNEIVVKRDQNFKGIWVLPEFPKENESGVKCETHAMVSCSCSFYHFISRVQTDGQRAGGSYGDPIRGVSRRLI